MSQDSKLILTSGMDKHVYLIDTFNNIVIDKIDEHDDTILSLGFSKCGNYFYTAGKDGVARLYSLSKYLVWGTFDTSSWHVYSQLAKTYKGEGEWIFKQGHTNHI